MPIDAVPAVIIDTLKHCRPCHDIVGDCPGVASGFNLSLFERLRRFRWLERRQRLIDGHRGALRKFEDAAFAGEGENIGFGRGPDDRPIGVGDGKTNAVSLAKPVSQIAELECDVVGFPRFQDFRHLMAITMREVEDAVTHARRRAIRENFAERSHQQGIADGLTQL